MKFLIILLFVLSSFATLAQSSFESSAQCFSSKNEDERYEFYLPSAVIEGQNDIANGTAIQMRLPNSEIIQGEVQALKVGRTVKYKFVFDNVIFVAVESVEKAAFSVQLGKNVKKLVCSNSPLMAL